MTSKTPISISSMSANTQEDQLHRINLQTLQNRDPFITKILDQAQRVCVYKFLADKREWERKDTEGTLFVYERLCEPMHGFTILSTVSRETFVQDLKSSMEFKHSPNQEAFLQYKVDVGDIFGLWFISKEDCPRVTETLKNLISQAKEREQNTHPMLPASLISSLASNIQQQTPSQHRPLDIYSLLLDAQEKFEESKRKQETNGHDAASTVTNPLHRLFSSQETNNGSMSANEEREQELKKTLGILGKPALSVSELEKQFLRSNASTNSTNGAMSNRDAPSTNGRLMTPADFQNFFIPPSPVPTMSHRNSSTVPSSKQFSKETLRQLLVNMLQNDEEFLIELHNAYTSKQQRLQKFVQ